MITKEEMQDALRAPHPAQALRAAVEGLFRTGRTKEEVYDLLEDLLLRLRKQPVPRESDEDLVLDAMDALTGWCHPSAALSPNGNSHNHNSQG